VGTTTAQGRPSMTSAPPTESSSTSPSSRLESVFEAAFLNFYARIVGVLARLLGDRARAEELADDVFLKLYRQPWLAGSDGNVGGWLYRTSTNLGIDALRAQARRHRYEDAAARARLETAAPSDPLQEVLRQEQWRRVRGVLSTLKPSQAQILVLRASGLSYRELAESLGVKRSSVGTMLIRAEVEFQERFRKLYGSKEEL
jgi:RNA polymerase sigma-70 factor, ECF subfamily